MTKLVLPRLNQTGANEWEDVQSNDVAIREVINGQLDTENLKTTTAGITADQLADAAKLGVSGATKFRRGKSVVATEQSITSTSYEFLATPDRVKEVEMPEDGIFWISYNATVKSSVASAGRAAIFIGANQVKVDQGGVAPVANDLTFSTTFTHALTSQIGLTTGSAESYNDVTTGQIMGYPVASNSGPICVYAAQGTYDIGVKFKSASGSVTAKNRKLWVKAEGF